MHNNEFLPQIRANQFLAELDRLKKVIQKRERLKEVYQVSEILRFEEKAILEKYADMRNASFQENKVLASGPEPECDILIEEGGNLLEHNAEKSNQNTDLSIQKTLMLKVRVLKFLREFTHVTAKELSDMMEGEFHSRSLIAAIENELRNPTEEFISEYAKALQKRVNVKRDLMHIVQGCIDDPEMLSLMDQYDQNHGGFVTTYKIAKKIILMDDSNLA